MLDSLWQDVSGVQWPPLELQWKHHTRWPVPWDVLVDYPHVNQRKGILVWQIAPCSEQVLF